MTIPESQRLIMRLFRTVIFKISRFCCTSCDPSLIITSSSIIRGVKSCPIPVKGASVA